MFTLPFLKSAIFIAVNYIIPCSSVYTLKAFESRKRHNEVKEQIIKVLLITAETVSILFETIEFFQMCSFWYFLTGTEWSPGVSNNKLCALAIFSGTFMITFITMAVALPIVLAMLSVDAGIS